MQLHRALPNKSKMTTSVSSLVSSQLDQFLNQLGFNEKDIKERICLFDKCTVARTLSARNIQKRYDIDRIFVGSQREGIGLSFVNDTDVLQIYKSCICLESSNISHQTAQPEAWFELDGTRTHPGHYFLKAHGTPEKLRLNGDIQHALVQRFGETYVSANKFMAKNDDMFTTSKSYLGKHTVFMQRHGPSWPKTVNTFEKRLLASYCSMNIGDKIDYVRGFPCVCNTILTRWLYRERAGVWPSMETMTYVVNLPAFVVPVAQNGTAHADLQWRVCFTLGELYLLRTLNNTHLKVYVLLKLVAQYMLRPVWPEISSFLMKHVLFWQAESTPFNDFRPDNLVTCLRKALEYLKHCLKTNNLPYYMMPERNLLLNKISRKQRRDVLHKLDDILNNGVENCYNYMLNESHNLTDCLGHIGEEMSLGYFVSKSDACKCSVLNAVDLAQYFESLFNQRFYLGCFLYNIWTVVIPCIYVYGMSVFWDPFNVNIPCTMDILESFRKSQLTNTEQFDRTISLDPEDNKMLPDSLKEISLAGGILIAEERVKCAVGCTDVSINICWKLQENIIEENGKNDNKHVKKTIEINAEDYIFDIVGSNNARTEVIVGMTRPVYKVLCALMLNLAFIIHIFSSTLELGLALYFAEECYFELITHIFESILLCVTSWKCRTRITLDVYIHSALKESDKASCITSDILEYCMSLASDIS